MSTSHEEPQGPRDVDAEFARMLEGEGLELRPGDAPREPAAQDPPDLPEDDGPELPPEQSRARSRAAHPSAGEPPSQERELYTDDEVLYGDFEQPDPDLPEASAHTLWSWTALIGGFALILAVTISSTLPMFLGALGGIAALGGLIGLLLRVPTSRDEDRGDGAEV